MNRDSIVITAIARTPLANFAGAFEKITVVTLGAEVIRAVVTRSGLKPEQVDEVYMGCVLSAGLGQAPARQAAIKGGLPVSTPCTTFNKVCGSGMKAIMLATDSLSAHSADIIIGGGMESMTGAPYLLGGARKGYRIGHQKILDHMLRDGLEDAWQEKPMGYYADQCANAFHFTREDQDHFALISLERAKKAIQDKKMAEEIISVAGIDTDEHPLSVSPQKISILKPAFTEKGTVTAANSSSLADGAAAVMVMREETAQKYSIKPLARIVAHVSHAVIPQAFTTAPIGAIQKLLHKTGWRTDEVDLFEINEAFAVVTMAAMQSLNIPHEKLNIHGGACALGHPIGATGARITVTLIAALRQHGLKRGIAALCIGGGEATAMAIEIP